MKNVDNYRISNPLYYGGKMNYSIERMNDKGKWVFVFGGLSYSEANKYLTNPELIKSEVLRLKIGAFFCLIILILFIFYIIIF